VKKVGVLYHPMIEPAHTLAEKLVKFLKSLGVVVWLSSAWEWEKAKALINGTDLILCVGGDGTILRAAQVALPDSTPITGINLGRLGFLTELSAAEAEAKIPALLQGKGWIDERAMLEAELMKPDKETSFFHALNDVVVARGAISRLIHVKVDIDGELLTTYRSDGVLVATATGSTGYSLAAGGPILHPQSNEFLLLPLLPHLSSTYSLVLSAKSVVRLHVSTPHQATLSIDGHINLPLPSGSIVTVKPSQHRAKFLRIHRDASFYGSLEQKLKGKQQGESNRKS